MKQAIKIIKESLDKFIENYQASINDRERDSTDNATHEFIGNSGLEDNKKVLMRLYYERNKKIEPGIQQPEEHYLRYFQYGEGR